MRKRNNEKIQTGLQRYAFGYGDKEGVPKIMFWDFKKGCHYTFMMNDFKSEIDIHRTSDTKSLNHHVGILKIKYYTCVKLLQRYEKTQIELLKKYFFSRTINLEELNDMDAILFPMDHVENEDAFVEKRGKKFNPKGEIFVKDIERMYKTPEECATLKAERFQVCCIANGRLAKRGLLFRNLHNNVMYFVSERKLEKYFEAMSTSFIEIVKTANFQSKENLLALLT